MGIVRESLFEDFNGLETSSGLAIIQGESILLGHPKGQKWHGTYSIPKGHVKPGEELIQAAIRETREEVGVTIDLKDIEPTPYYIDYKDKKGKVYKRLYYFIVKPDPALKNSSINPDGEEIDWAGFILKEPAKSRIFWRLKPILNHIEKPKEEDKEEDKDLEIDLEDKPEKENTKKEDTESEKAEEIDL